MDTKKTAKQKRPASVTWLAVGVLILAGIYLLRAALAVRDWAFLAGLPSVSPLYVFLTGLIWTAAWLPVFWGLWTGRIWAPRRAQTTLFVFLVYFWLDRLLLFHPYGPDGSDPARLFWGIASLLSAGLMVWMTTNKKARVFFGRPD